MLLHLPPAAARGPVPLVLAFHGHLANGAILRRSSRLDAAADSAGVAIAYPDGTGRLGWAALSWHADRDCCDPARADRIDDVAFTRGLIATLGTLPTIDTTRVAAVGFSAGGMLALRLACERLPVVRAAVDVAGTMPHEACAPGRPTSVLLFQGGADDELRGELRALRLARAPRRTHSLENALRYWAAQGGCAPGPPLRDSSAAEVHERADGCPPGVAVELHTVAHNPHAWPGGRRPWHFSPRPAPQVDAAHVALDFLERTAWPGAAAVARAYADSVSEERRGLGRGQPGRVAGGR